MNRIEDLLEEIANTSNVTIRDNSVKLFNTFYSENVNIISKNNNIISEWLMELRDEDIQKDRLRFRKNILKIGEIIGYEISKTLKYKEIDVKTPISNTKCYILEKQPVLATILRAGLPLYEGLLNIFDKADSSFIASYRQHTEDGLIGVQQQYVAKPSIEGRPLIIADTMLATGSSLLLAIKDLIKDETPSELHIVSVISSPEGLSFIMENLPEAKIWTASIDYGLNNDGYIIPGLGDAGDLLFGTKL